VEIIPLFRVCCKVLFQNNLRITVGIKSEFKKKRDLAPVYLFVYYFHNGDNIFIYGYLETFPDIFVKDIIGEMV